MAAQAAALGEGQAVERSDVQQYLYCSGAKSWAVENRNSIGREGEN